MEPKKVGLMWFDFLFDKTGLLLNSHLSAPNADPNALQLMQQFLDKSGCVVFPNGQEVPQETNNKRKQRLLLLALHVLSHLEWNLSILEGGLPLHMQFILLKELVKMYDKETQDVSSTLDLTKCEKASIIPLLLYHRWVVRAIVQQSSSKLSENKTIEATSDSKGSKPELDKLLSKLQAEEAFSTNVLQQSISWKEDLQLPMLPSSTWTEENEDSCKSSNETHNDATVSEKMETEVTNEESKIHAVLNKVISSQEIIGQTSYDLGTLYFYKEDIEKAKGLFELCSSVQCPNSSFYTVDKKTLSGYYTACCSLLHCPVRDDLVSHQSLMSQIEQSKYNGYKNLVDLLIKDNVLQEVPHTYRKSLESDVARVVRQGRADTRIGNNLLWHVSCCNAVGSILAGMCVDPEIWKKLENSTKDQFEYFIKICKDSVVQMVDYEKGNVDKSRQLKIESVIETLLAGRYAGERLEILARVDTNKVINIPKNALEKRSQVSRNSYVTFSPITHQTHQAARSDIQVQISQLEHELQTTTCASQVPNVLMQLHGLDPDPHKKHAKGHENTVYATYIQDLKDDILQDLLHVLFSKANQCTLRKDYLEAKSFLDFGFQTIQEQRKRYGNTSTFDKMSNFLSQEILVTNILMAEENHEKVSDDLLKRIKSNLFYTMQDYVPRPHVTEMMITYLLNMKEWGMLSEMDTRGTAPNSFDYREIGRCLAGVCISVTKPPHWRKMSKNLWDAILKIFTSVVQHKRMLPDGTIIDVKRDPGNLPFFVKFISKIKEETCLSLIISCLERMRDLEAPNDEESKDQKNFTMYSHLWPTSIPSSSNVNFTQVGLALLESIDHSVTAHPFNSTFLRIQGDTFYENENHLNALRCYLQSGAASSDFFSHVVPKSVWDNTVYRKMISCCSAFQAHTQVAVLCQFLDPLDYTLAFNAMKQTTHNDASEFYYNCIWDITLLEFIVHIHAKRGEHDKKQVAIQALGQPELNACNPPEILQNAKRIRNSRFLRVLAKQYL